MIVTFHSCVLKHEEEGFRYELLDSVPSHIAEKQEEVCAPRSELPEGGSESLPTAVFWFTKPTSLFLRQGLSL